MGPGSSRTADVLIWLRPLIEQHTASRERHQRSQPFSGSAVPSVSSPTALLLLHETSAAAGAAMPVRPDD